MIEDGLRETNLSAFARHVLLCFERTFPTLVRYTRISELDDFAWIADIPCPDGTPPHRVDYIVRVRTHGYGTEPNYGEEFRVDWGNRHEHFGCYSQPIDYKFLDEAFAFLDEILSDRLVLRSSVWPSGYHVQQIVEPDWPIDSEAWEHDTVRIEQWSWNGKHNKIWLRSEQ